MNKDTPKALDAGSEREATQVEVRDWMGTHDVVLRSTAYKALVELIMFERAEVLSTNTQQAAKSAAHLPEGQHDPLEEFQDGQWWVLELDAMARADTATDDQKRAVAVVHNFLRGTAALLAKSAAPAAARSDAEIVEQTERVAALLGAHFQGSAMADGRTYRDATNPKAIKCWMVACVIQELLTQTDPENSVSELEEELAAPMPATQAPAAVTEATDHDKARHLFDLAERWADARVQGIRENEWGPWQQETKDALWEACKVLATQAPAIAAPSSLDLSQWKKARFGVFHEDGRFEELSAEDPCGEDHPRGHTARWVGGRHDMQLLHAALSAPMPAGAAVGAPVTYLRASAGLHPWQAWELCGPDDGNGRPVYFAATTPTTGGEQ